MACYIPYSFLLEQYHRRIAQLFMDTLREDKQHEREADTNDRALAPLRDQQPKAAQEVGADSRQSLVIKLLTAICGDSPECFESIQHLTRRYSAMAVLSSSLLSMLHYSHLLLYAVSVRVTRSTVTWRCCLAHTAGSTSRSGRSSA